MCRQCPWLTFLISVNPLWSLSWISSTTGSQSMKRKCLNVNPSFSLSLRKPTSVSRWRKRWWFKHDPDTFIMEEVQMKQIATAALCADTVQTTAGCMCVYEYVLYFFFFWKLCIVFAFHLQGLLEAYGSPAVVFNIKEEGLVGICWFTRLETSERRDAYSYAEFTGNKVVKTALYVTSLILPFAKPMAPWFVCAETDVCECGSVCVCVSVWVPVYARLKSDCWQRLPCFPISPLANH